MAWTAPMTFSAGSVLTAAQLNTHLRDNLLEAAPAKASTAGQIFAATGLNAIVARYPDTAYVPSSETTASTSYGDLATVGPAVTATTGTRSLIIISSFMRNNTANYAAQMGYAVSGASTISADDTKCILIIAAAANAGATISGVFLETALNAGSNTVTAKYKSGGGGSTSTFQYRRTSVVSF